MTTCALPRRLSVVRQRQASFMLPLTVLSLLFLGTGLIGVWAAYNRSMAWPRFALLSLAVILTIAVVRFVSGERSVTLLGIGCAVLAGGVGTYYLLTGDPAATSQDDFVAFPFLSAWIARDHPILMATSMHSNAVGGALAVTLPLGGLGIYGSWRQRWPAGIAIATFGTAVALAVLILTSSRGAWIGLSAGCTVAFMAHIILRIGQPDSPNARLGQWLLPAALGCVPWLVLAVAHPAGPFDVAALLNVQGADPSLSGRLNIWHNMLTLIEDYLYSGSGLGSTEMVYSTYAALLHVGIFQHAHNLFLQIAVEQGLPGLLAFAALIAMAVSAITRRRQENPLPLVYLSAPLISLVALLIHGAVDAELYASPLLPVILLPVATTLAVDGMLPETAVHRPRLRSLQSWLFGLPTLLFALSVLLPNPLAAFYANAGTVSQTRAELSIYHWPEWPVQDAVRRAGGVDLISARIHYGESLAVDASNRVANRRLGQIALSQGEYAAACTYLERAGAASVASITARLLGECYAVNGHIEQAALLWEAARISDSQIEIRRWWYTSIGETQAAASIARVATLMEQRP